MMTAKIIKIYSTPKCAECLRVKDYLDEKRLFYQEVNMTKLSPQDQAKLKIFSVPVIEVDGKRYYSLREFKEKYE